VGRPPDDGTAPPPIDPEAWERAAWAGENIVKRHVVDRIRRRLDRHDHPAHMFALVFGVVSETARLARALCVHKDDETIAIVERAMMAYVRGQIRGLDGPIDEDGSPYDGIRGP
jgi:hypothetical protein